MTYKAFDDCEMDLLHLRGTAHARRRGVDRHAGHLARQRVHEVGILHGGDLLGSDLLDVVRQRLLLALDAQRRHDHLLDLRRRLLKRYAERRARANRNRGRLVAQVADFKIPRRRRCRDFQREAALGIGRDAQRGAPHDHRSADDRLPGGIGHAALNPNRSRFGLRAVGNDDTFAVDVIGNAVRSKNSIQNFGN